MRLTEPRLTELHRVMRNSWKKISLTEAFKLIRSLLGSWRESLTAENPTYRAHGARVEVTDFEFTEL